MNNCLRRTTMLFLFAVSALTLTSAVSAAAPTQPTQDVVATTDQKAIRYAQVDDEEETGSSRKPRRPRGTRRTVSLGANGLFEFNIVGESFYQDALQRLAGGRSEKSADITVEAELSFERDNPTDARAVRVEINGVTVGHLSRSDARQWQRRMRAAGAGGAGARCQAKIVGGWDRGPDQVAFYGVKLDVPTQGALILASN